MTWTGRTAALVITDAVTVELAAVAMLMSIVIAIPLGVAASTHRGSGADKLALTLGVVGISIPDFWLGIMLILFIALGLGILPSSGYTPFGQNPIDNLKSVVLPAATLAAGLGAVLTRMTRASMLDVLRQDFVKVSRAKGLPELHVVYRHALPNAGMPIVTVLGLQSGYLLGGAVIVEQVFALPGVGNLVVNATLERNYPVVQSAVLTAMDTTAPLRRPSLNHLFGTDNFGRDVFSRTLYGYRASLFAALGSVAVAAATGVPLGLIAGYLGSLVDNLVMRTMDILLAFPAILWVIALVSVLGTNTGVLALAIGFIYAPILARVMRASALAVKEEVFVESARALGAHELTIMLRHVLPNAISPVLVQASILMGIAILIEAALSFIGLGTQPPDPSLGLMLSDGRDIMQEAPWVVVFPGLAIVAAVLGFNLLGDGLRDLLDPRSRV